MKGDESILHKLDQSCKRGWKTDDVHQGKSPSDTAVSSRPTDTWPSSLTLSHTSWEIRMDQQINYQSAKQFLPLPRTDFETNYFQN